MKAKYKGVAKVISGGQTGADMGALKAAYRLGIATGGWAVNGFHTEAGGKPILGSKYKLEEMSSLSNFSNLI